MPKALLRSSCVPVLGMLLVVLTAVIPRTARAIDCPGPGATPAQAQALFDEFVTRRLSRAGADCAAEWARSFVAPERDFTAAELKAWKVAADVQRRAHDQPDTEKAQAQRFLAQEVEIRRRALELIVRNADIELQGEQRREAIVHLASLVDAQDRLAQFKDIADDLPLRPPWLLREDPLRVWLKAVRSCQAWDGNASMNVCDLGIAQACRSSHSAFMDAVLGSDGQAPAPAYNASTPTGRRLRHEVEFFRRDLAACTKS